MSAPDGHHDEHGKEPRWQAKARELYTERKLGLNVAAGVCRLYVALSGEVDFLTELSRAELNGTPLTKS